jgi:hypothetical protein
MRDSEYLEMFYKAVQRIAPHERQWTRFRINSNTFNTLKKLADYKDPPPEWCIEGEDFEECMKRNGRLPGSQIFGIPIDIDQFVPDDSVKIDTETPQERRIKEFIAEMARQGKTANVVVSRGVDYPAMYAPLKEKVPTLKGLLKHWLGKVRKGIRDRSVSK